jgi:hypothetical protein
MEESITFQEIKGLGRLEEVRKIIARQGTRKFGKRNRKVERVPETITDLEKLESILDRVLEANSWDELFPGR